MRILLLWQKYAKAYFLYAIFLFCLLYICSTSYLNEETIVKFEYVILLDMPTQEKCIIEVHTLYTDMLSYPLQTTPNCKCSSSSNLSTTHYWASFMLKVLKVTTRVNDQLWHPILRKLYCQLSYKVDRLKESFCWVDFRQVFVS